MKIQYDKSFYKSLEKIKDRSILKRIETVILRAEKTENIDRLPNSKKLVGYAVYYRIKLGDYRIGFELISATE